MAKTYADSLRETIKAMAERLVAEGKFNSRTDWINATQRLMGKDPNSKSGIAEFMRGGQRSLGIAYIYALAETAGVQPSEFFTSDTPRDDAERELLKAYRQSSIDGRRLALLALAAKPETDDPPAR